MKITMSFKEVAALAGLVKETRELVNPKEEKETVQQMMATLVENYSDPEKYGFVSMKLNSHMDLVIKAEPDAIIRIMELIKKYVVAYYPLYKAATEVGFKLSSDIQEIIDDYTEKEEPVEHHNPNPVGVVIIKERPDLSEKMKAMCSGNKDENKKKKMDAPSRLFKCTACSNSALIRNNKKNVFCKKCGAPMELIAE